MRKRIVIGLFGFGFVAMLIVVPLVWMRPDDPIQQHRKAFEAACNEWFGRKWFTPVETVYCRLTKTPRRLPNHTSEQLLALQARLDSNRIALVRLGYLVERTIVLSNQPVQVVAGRISAAMRPMVPVERAQYTQFSWNPATNVYVVIGFKQDMPIWEELIRKADVPD